MDSTAPNLPRADITAGYTRIANLLLEALCCAPLSASQFRVVAFVLRRTDGWLNVGGRPHKLDVFSRGELCRATGLAKGTAATALAGLRRSRVLIAVPAGAPRLWAYGMNRNVNDWGGGATEWSGFRAVLSEARQERLFRFNDSVNEPPTENCPAPTQNRPACELGNESPATEKRVGSGGSDTAPGPLSHRAKEKEKKGAPPPPRKGGPPYPHDGRARRAPRVTARRAPTAAAAMAPFAGGRELASEDSWTELNGQCPRDATLKCRYEQAHQAWKTGSPLAPLGSTYRGFRIPEVPYEGE